MSNFSVIGAGNVGLSLIEALRGKGYTLKFIYQKSKAANLDLFINDNLREIVRVSDFIFISTQESRITPAAEAVAREADVAGRIFFHTSNSLTSEQLAPLKHRGAVVASLSPLQTFTEKRRGGELLTGITFLAEGDKQALSLARQLVTALGSELLEVRKEEKVYYHIAAVSSANFLISILKLARDQLEKTDTDRGLDILYPLVQQTLNNARENGLLNAISGPLNRGELGLIEKHIAHLSTEEADLYRMLSAYLAK